LGVPGLDVVKLSSALKGVLGKLIETSSFSLDALSIVIFW
jgi:hypothetical protein